jgi:hypothetical protein
MSVSSLFSVATQAQKKCTCPTLGEMLPDYVVELLADAACVEVEDHLLDCLHCRKKYLKMLSFIGARRQVNGKPGFEAGSAQQDTLTSSKAKVLSMADFKRRCA